MLNGGDTMWQIDVAIVVVIIFIAAKKTKEENFLHIFCRQLQLAATVFGENFFAKINYRLFIRGTCSPTNEVNRFSRKGKQ